MLNSVYKRFIEFFFYGNVFISLCTTGLLLQTYVLLGVKIQFDSIAFLVFFSTLFIYSLHRLFAYRRIPIDQRGPITSWASRNYFSLFMMVIVGGGGAIIMSFHLTQTEFFALLLPGIISFLYEFPLIRHNKQFKRIRNFWLLKVFLITAVWGFTTVALPAIEAGLSLVDWKVWLLVLNRSLFILPLALCFDARDILFDKAEGLNTIPIKIGLEKMPRLYVQLLAAFVIASMLQFGFLPAFRPGVLLALIASAFITYRMVIKTIPRKSDLYYTFGVDGMMILQFLLVWLFNLIVPFTYVWF